MNGFGVAAAMLAGVCLYGQEQDLSIKLSVDLIQIDVTVLDKNRRQVPGLTTEDFEVLRDGKKQPIQKVLYVAKPEKNQAVAQSAPSLAPQQQQTALLVAPKQPAARDIRRTIAIFIDDLSIGLANLPATRDALRKFVQEEIAEGDVLAIYRSSGGLGLFQQFTADKRAMLAGIEQLRFRSINGVDSLAPIENNSKEDDPNPTIAQMAIDARLREEANLRLRQDALTAGMLSSAAFIVQGLRELPGRKSMVIFSESIQLYDVPQSLNNLGADPMMPNSEGGVRRRTLAAMQSLIDLANRSGVTFYTVDPRGLQVLGITVADQVSANPRRTQGRVQQRKTDFMAAQDGMSLLAEQTGGLFFRNTNDLGKALSEAAQDQDAYYLIAFRPDEETFEKTRQGKVKMHSLQIKVHKPGLKVRYRRAFAGSASPEDAAGASKANPLTVAMSSPFRSTEIGVKMTPLYLEGQNPPGPFIRTLLYLDPAGFQFEDEAAASDDKDQTPWRKTVADELVVLYDQAGRVVEQVAQSQIIRVRKPGFEKAMQTGLVQVLDIAVKQPGAVQIRAAVMDHATQRTGSAAQFLFIPDVKNKQLAMSDVTVVSDAVLNSQAAGGVPAQRVMRPGDRLNYGAYLYNAKAVKGSSPAKANLEVQIVLYREGKVVFTGKKALYQPEGYVEGQPIGVSGTLQLTAKSEPGEYVLQVAVRDLEAPKKAQFALKAADFEVR